MSEQVIISALLFLAIYILTYLLAMYCWKWNYEDGRKLSLRSNFYNGILIFLVTIPFAMLCALRAYDTGYDTHSYIDGFSGAQFSMREMLEGSFDYLFEICLRVTFLIFNGNATPWLFIIASLSLFPTFLSIQKCSICHKDFALGCFLFLLNLSPIMLDQSRQFIAVGIVMYATWQLSEGKRNSFVILTLTATLFHESALLMLFLILIPTTKTVRRLSFVWLFSIITLSLFFMPFLISIFMPFLPEKFAYISLQAHSEVSGKAWIIDLLPVAFSLYAYYKYAPKRRNKIILEVCAWSALPFRMAGYSSFFIMRMSYYGEAVCVLLLMETLSLMPLKKRNLIKRYSLFIFLIHWYVDFVYLGLNGAIPYFPDARYHI